MGLADAGLGSEPVVGPQPLYPGRSHEEHTSSPEFKKP